MKRCPLIRIAAFAVMVQAAAAENDTHTVPLFPSAADSLGRQGFVRVINHSAESGEVTVEAFDDSDWDYEPVVLSIDANETAHFNSDDLEEGNAAKGLPNGVGPGDGDWWLKLSSDLDIEVLGYIRTTDGFLTAMNYTVLGVEGRYRIPTFNPGSNEDQLSLLRLINTGGAEADVAIRGIDDDGESSGDAVRVTVPPATSRTLDAQQLEEGGSGVEGALGDGSGKWRLQVDAEQAILVMSLMSTPTGHLTNLSWAHRRTTEAGPDLVVVDPRVTNANPSPGTYTTLSVEVRNQGRALASTTTLHFYRSSNATISTNDVEVGSTGVGSLAPSATREKSIEVDEFEGDVFYLGACIDEVPGEVDTLNNCTEGVQVEVVREKAVAWSVSECSATSTDDGPVDVTVVVMMEARRSASSVHVEAYARLVDDEDEVFLGEESVGDLAAGDSRDVTITASLEVAADELGSCRVSVSWQDVGEDVSVARMLDVDRPEGDRQRPDPR